MQQENVKNARAIDSAAKSDLTSTRQHAIAHLQTLASQEPPDSHACFALGEIALQNGQKDYASAFYGRALIASPTWLAPVERLVELMLPSSRFQEIDRLMQSVSEQNAEVAAFHLLSARILIALGAPDTGAAAVTRALNCADADGEILLRASSQLREIGKLNPALAVLEKAKAHPETKYRALVNGGALLQILDRPGEAIQWYAQAAATTPGDKTWLPQWVDALFAAGEYTAWKDLIEQQFSELPADEKTRLAFERAQFFADFQATKALMTDKRELHTETPFRQQHESLSYQRLFVDRSPSQLRSDYESKNAHFGAIKPRHDGQNRNEAVRIGTERALKIGYISADFRSHVVGEMFLPVFRQRERATHRVSLYSLAVREDETSQAFQETADDFIRCFGVSDDAIANRIAADKIDILVDLSGPTAGSRPGVLARKPAPVIITHVGAAGPIGLSAVDYKLTDSICDLPENQEYLIEQLLPMAGCCYPVPKYPLPTQGVTKAALGLESNVTLGAFFSYMKLSERCVRLWKQVLDAIPNAVILFSPLDPKLRVAYENIMRAVEIPPERYRFLPCGPTVAEQLARYRVVDMVIDSMPYGGVNGTLEALYMGVPVVTQLGTHHSERTSASMLTHLGVTDTIAQSPSEYVSIARKLAESPELRSDISTRIRARWPKFADPTDYARRWEAVLRKVAR